MLKKNLFIFFNFIFKKITLINLISICFFIINFKYTNKYFALSFFIIWNIFLLINIRRWKFLLIINVIFIISFFAFNYRFNYPNHISNKEFRIILVKQNYIIISNHNLKIYCSCFKNNYIIGQKVLISGYLKKINFNHNKWEFNFKDYLNFNNITYQLQKNFKINVIANNKSIKYAFYSWISKKSDLEKTIFGNIKQGIIYENLSLLSLTYLTNIILPIYFFMSKLLDKIFHKNKSSWIKIWIAQFFLFFIFIQNSNPLLLKSYLYILIRNISIIKNKYISKLNLFSLIWSIELIYNPWYLFNIGFIYIAIFLIFYQNFFNSNKIIKYLKTFLLINIINIPMQCYFDYKIYWLSSIFQIFLFPIVLLSSIVLIIPFLFDIDSISIFVNNILLIITNFFSKLNITTNVGHFSFIFLIIYFLSLKFFLINYKKKCKLLFFVVCILSFLSLSTYNYFTYPESITMLNVGNGNSIIGRLNNKYYIFDAGAGFGKSKKIFSNYLLYYGINNIEHAFISHGDSDHWNQLEEIKNVVKIKNESWNNKNFKKIWNENNLTFYSFLNLKYKDENSKSQIIFFKIDGRIILLPGDATNKTLNDLTNNEFFLKLINKHVDLYIAPHHGSKTSDSLFFLKKIKPKNIFISCKYQKNRPFPSESTIKNMEKVGAESICITGNSNSFRYIIKSNKIEKL